MAVACKKAFLLFPRSKNLCQQILTRRQGIVHKFSFYHRLKELGVTVQSNNYLLTPFIVKFGGKNIKKLDKV